MKGAEFAVALVGVIICGGYVGVIVDRRRRRRPDDEYPRRYVNDVRMNRLHIIEDEWLNRKVGDDER